MCQVRLLISYFFGLQVSDIFSIEIKYSVEFCDEHIASFYTHRRNLKFMYNFWYKSSFSSWSAVISLPIFYLWEILRTFIALLHILRLKITTSTNNEISFELSGIYLSTPMSDC
jgi:hypothetical protein